MGRPSPTEFALAAGLFGLAVLARWPLAGAPPYGDEAAHFTMARTLGFLDQSIQLMGPDVLFQLYPLTLGRPMFALFFSPAAFLGFGVFRATGILVSSVLPVVVFFLARSASARRPAAIAAAFAVALHPAFIVWGARVFPDSLMAVLALSGLWAWRGERFRTAGLLFLLAAWTKETAIPLVGGFAVWIIFQEGRSRWERGLVGAALFRLTPKESWIALATVLGPLGVIASYLAYPQLPGWTSAETPPAAAVEALLLSSWLLVPLALAALVPKARGLAFALVALLAFYGIVVLRGLEVNAWYAILPAALAICVAVVVLDFGLRSLRWPRVGAGLASVGLSFMAVVAVTGLSGPLASAFHPMAPHDEPGLADSTLFVRQEHAFLTNAIAFHEEANPRLVMEIDVSWFWVGYPFGGEETVFVYTILAEPSPALLRRAIEGAERSDLTWVQDAGSPFHLAFRDTYSDCMVFSDAPLTAYRIQNCTGRHDQFMETLAEAQTSSQT